MLENQLFCWKSEILKLFYSRTGLLNMERDESANSTTLVCAAMLNNEVTKKIPQPKRKHTHTHRERERERERELPDAPKNGEMMKEHTSCLSLQIMT